MKHRSVTIATNYNLLNKFYGNNQSHEDYHSNLSVLIPNINNFFTKIIFVFRSLFPVRVPHVLQFPLVLERHWRRLAARTPAASRTSVMDPYLPHPHWGHLLTGDSGMITPWYQSNGSTPTSTLRYVYIWYQSNGSTTTLRIFTKKSGMFIPWYQPNGSTPTPTITGDSGMTNPGASLLVPFQQILKWPWPFNTQLIFKLSFQTFELWITSYSWRE